MPDTMVSTSIAANSQMTLKLSIIIPILSAKETEI